MNANFRSLGAPATTSSFREGACALISIAQDLHTIEFDSQCQMCSCRRSSASFCRVNNDVRVSSATLRRNGSMPTMPPTSLSHNPLMIRNSYLASFSKPILRNAHSAVHRARVSLQTPHLLPQTTITPLQPHRTMASSTTKNFGDTDQRKEDASSADQRPAHELRHDAEKLVARNPHPDFSKVQASRPDWEEKSQWHFTKTRRPDWKLGQGANDGGESLQKKHVEIDPYEQGRPATFNYKLLISGIIPRPIGFVSTRSEDGASRLFLLHSPTPPRPKPSLKAGRLMWILDRQIYESRPLLLHPSNKPRPSPLHHRFRRWLCQRQRHPHQSPGYQGMHHQYHLRTLPRSRQLRFHQCSLRYFRMGPFWLDTRVLYGC